MKKKELDTIISFIALTEKSILLDIMWFLRHKYKKFRISFNLHKNLLIIIICGNYVIIMIISLFAYFVLLFLSPLLFIVCIFLLFLSRIIKVIKNVIS